MGSTGEVVGQHGGGVATARADARRRTDPLGERHLDGNPLADLRPARAGAILDSSFDLLRFRFRRLVGLAAALLIPIQLLELVIVLATGGISNDLAAQSTGPLLFALADSGAMVWWMVLARSVALSMLGIGVGQLVHGLVRGVDVPFTTVLRTSLTRCWVALLIVPLTLLIRLPLACVPLVGWLLGDAFVFMSSIAAGAERLGPFAAVGRSLKLSRGGLNVAIAVSLGGLCITQVLRFSLIAGPYALLSIFAPPDGVYLLVDQATSLVLLISEPLTACIAACCYLDLRCRIEGADLRTRMATP